MTLSAKRTLYKGKFLELAAVGEWEFAHRLNEISPVGIIAKTPDDKLILISQFRIPVGKRVIEIPAGLIGDGPAQPGAAPESWQTAARRELEEETGWTAARFELLTHGPTSAGMTTECMYLVRAHEVFRHGPQQPDGEEDITVHEVPLSEAKSWLQAREAEGVLIDPKVWAALYFLS